jgi:hypothetical protein
VVLCLAPILLIHCIQPCCADRVLDCCPAASITAAPESNAASRPIGKGLVHSRSFHVELYPALSALMSGLPSTAMDPALNDVLGSPLQSRAPLVVLRI